MARSLGILRPLKASRVCFRWLVCGREIHDRVGNPGSRVLLQGGLTVSNLDAKPPQTQSREAQSGTGKIKAKKEAESEEQDSSASDVDLSRVCAGLNYFKTGEDPPIRDNSEYPAWLWNILEPVKSHKELSPDSKMYWRRLNKQKARENNLRSQQILGR